MKPPSARHPRAPGHRLMRAGVLGAGLALASAGLGACSTDAGPGPTQSGPVFPAGSFLQWNAGDPLYRVYPGDELEVTFRTAPELSRSVVVQPDGRIALPQGVLVTAIDKSVPEVQQEIEAAYGAILQRPDVDVTPRTFASQQIFVGGEVQRPGIYPLPGQMDALQAVIQAGGFLPSAKRRQVVVLRRAAGGSAAMRIVDLAAMLETPSAADMVPLTRFDIIYVPRSGIAEVNLWVQQYIRDTLPFQPGFSFALNGATR